MYRKTTGIVAGLAVGVVALAVPALAHHSFPATYDIDQQITIEGKVVRFLFRNPHSMIHVEAPDVDGNMQRWAVEWAAAGALRREGTDQATLKAGDVVQITGNPGRNVSEYRVRLQSIKRPSDGWGWSGEFD